MIHIHHGALDETETGDIILRGVLQNEHIEQLRVDDYQREAMPLASLGSILTALRNADPLPDIILGMRGQNFTEPAPGTFALDAPIYIIDGLQRVTGVLHHLKSGKPPRPRLGCLIHFDTDKAWERDRFRVLNLLRARVAPSVLLRNMREESMAVLTLYGICRDESAVLHDRVCWQQNMLKGHLLTAMTLTSAVGSLHAHCGPYRSYSIQELVPMLNRLVTAITLPVFRSNVTTLFDLMEKAWGVRNVTYKAGATYLRRSFLETFARFLSDHLDFWEGSVPHQLRIPYALGNKIASFPVKDPEVVRLSAASGKAQQILYQLILDHVNSGKRSQRLRHRHARAIAPFDVSSFDQDDEEGEAA